jgi:hypothetical protein
VSAMGVPLTSDVSAIGVPPAANGGGTCWDLSLLVPSRSCDEPVGVTTGFDRLRGPRRPGAAIASTLDSSVQNTAIMQRADNQLSLGRYRCPTTKLLFMCGSDGRRIPSSRNMTAAWG